jgi:hypothetical protein
MARVNKLQNKTSGFTIFEVIIIIVAIIALLFTVHFVTHRHATTSTSTSSTNSTTSSTTSTTNQYAVLSPATVPSKVPECSQTLTFSSTGDPGPITCANNDINILAWQALAALEPKVMTLGYSAASSQVQTTLCADVSANVSNTIEETSYQISYLYYGWNFTADPSVVLANDTCKNVDD